MKFLWRLFCWWGSDLHHILFSAILVVCHLISDIGLTLELLWLDDLFIISLTYILGQESVLQAKLHREFSFTCKLLYCKIAKKDSIKKNPGLDASKRHMSLGKKKKPSMHSSQFEATEDSDIPSVEFQMLCSYPISENYLFSSVLLRCTIKQSLEWTKLLSKEFPPYARFLQFTKFWSWKKLVWGKNFLGAGRL